MTTLSPVFDNKQKLSPLSKTDRLTYGVKQHYHIVKHIQAPPLYKTDRFTYGVMQHYHIVNHIQAHFFTSLRVL